MVSVKRLLKWEELITKKYGLEFGEIPENQKHIKEVEYSSFHTFKTKLYMYLVRTEIKTIDLSDCINMFGFLDLSKIESKTHNKMIDIGIEQDGSWTYIMSLKEMCKIVYTKDEYKLICKSMSRY